MKPLIRLLLLTLAWVAAGSSAQTAPRSLGPSAPVTEIDRVVAVVNTDVITFLEVEMRRRSVERQLRQRRIEAPPEEELRKQVLERLISDRALAQAARDASSGGNHPARISPSTTIRALPAAATKSVE